MLFKRDIKKGIFGTRNAFIVFHYTYNKWEKYELFLYYVISTYKYLSMKFTYNLFQTCEVFELFKRAICQARRHSKCPKNGYTSIKRI